MKSILDDNRSLPALTVPPTGEPHLDSHAALTPSSSSTPYSLIPHPGAHLPFPFNLSSASGVHRAASSLNMQDDHSHQSSDAAAAALAEKKRNKLGYHRTSVACAHCRRRKIRCLVEHDDPQGRCSNCIRLKKECNFYPVDQQPASSGAKRPPVRGTSQASSSPAPQNTAASDQMNPYPPPPPMPMGYPPPLASMHGTGMPMAPIETNAYHSPMRSSTWDPSYMESPMSAGGQFSEAGTPGFWKSPVTNDYSPYGSQPESARSAHFPGHYPPGRQDSWAQGMQPSQASTPVHPLASSQTPMQAQRSMSLQHESSGGMYGGASHMSESPYYDAARGPPSLYASTGSPATSVSLSDGTSAPGQTQPATMSFSLQGQAWDPSKAGMDYGQPGGWYPDPASMSHAQEPQQGWSQHPGNYKNE